MKGVFRRLKCNVFFISDVKNNICYDIKNEICYILTKISLHENLVIVGSVTSWRGRRHNNNNNNTSICKAHNVSIRAESEAPAHIVAAPRQAT